MRLAALLAVAVSISCATPAFAQNQPEAGIPGGIGLTYDTVVHSYGLTRTTASPREELATLNRWCAGKRHADRQRCDAAWKRINAEHARMQAARAIKG